jgi:hypothetical protein
MSEKYASFDSPSSSAITMSLASLASIFPEK